MEYAMVHKTFYKIGDFVTWVREGSVNLNPEFQRRAVWKATTKSYLMDTIVKGLPIPIIFLRDRGIDLTTYRPTREVVDGQQRLRTVLSYIAPGLLPDFDPKQDPFTVKKTHNAELANKSFSDIPAPMQAQILNYQFDVHVLPDYVDDRQVIEIFRRMNSTNYQLNPQELRNSRYKGEFKTSVYMLAEEQLHRWRQWGTFTSDDIARMIEVELTSELAILILEGKLRGKSKKLIDSAYDARDEEYPERTEVESRYRTVMDTIDDCLAEAEHELPFARKGTIYSLFACFYDEIYGLQGHFVAGVSPRQMTRPQLNRIAAAREAVAEQKAPLDVLNSMARRTTNIKERTAVYRYLRGEGEWDA